jgi:hypothetical protein
MAEKKTYRLNVKRLVDDLGGAAGTALMVGVQRTAPYRWIKDQYLSSYAMERIKAARPDIVLDDYFEEAE